jgi:hypothetical protein
MALRKLPALAILVLVLVLVASAANAQSLPNFDAQRRCLKLAMTPDVPTETFYADCMANERAAYAAVQSSWGKVAAVARSRCLSVAGGSYAALQGCIRAQ